MILADAQARIGKMVRKVEPGQNENDIAFSNTPPAVTSDDLVQYRLTPSLTSGAATLGIYKDVWIEDCLPDTHRFVGATLTPAVVERGSTPDDAKRKACGTGETYVRWVIPQHEVNTPIEPIIVSAQIDPMAKDGASNSDVVIWAEGDASTLSQRTDFAGITIENAHGMRIMKTPLTPVVQVNREDQQHNELNEWSVHMSNTIAGSGQVPTNVDIIDVMPRNGLNGSDFNGTFTFDSIELTAGHETPSQPVSVLYTKQAEPNEDPDHATNAPGGSTVWCDAPAKGAVASGVGTAADCPQTKAEVTAARVLRPGDFGEGAEIEFTFRALAVGNRDEDTYVNSATATTEDVAVTLETRLTEEVAIESRIGDTVWWDLNRDGLKGLWNGEAEPGAAGIAVRVEGVDDLGNEVKASDALNHTKTDRNGKYLFERLRSSDAEGYTVTFTKPDGTEFTEQLVGDDYPLNSDADPETGAAPAVVLASNFDFMHIDAGLLPFGKLQVLKNVEGSGAGDFAKDDTYKFDLACVFDQQNGTDPDTVFEKSFELKNDASGALESDAFGPIPAFADCTVTETDSGNADETPAPVTVQVPWAADKAETQQTVVASMTNYVSAGTVQVTKKIEGDKVGVAAAKNTVFDVLVTCQIEEEDAQGESVIADIASGTVSVKGGESAFLLDDAGDKVKLPLGARCFGEEVNTGGAQSSTVDFDSWENAAEVTKDGEVLSIAAVNTFTDAEFTVSKKVVGPGTGGKYSFELACTMPGVDDEGQAADIAYELPAKDAKFTLKDGQSKTITVPTDASCRVTETDVPDGAVVTYKDSDKSTEGGAGDGALAGLEGDANWVKVTNTFEPDEPGDPGDPGDPSDPGTPGDPDGSGNTGGTAGSGGTGDGSTGQGDAGLATTGGQLLGGFAALGALLLIAGAALFLRQRREAETPSE